MYFPYNTEFFSSNIKHIKDTVQNRVLLENMLGKGDVWDHQYSYIKINIEDKTWMTSFDFEWLYRNQPPLITIEELQSKWLSK